MFTFLYGHCHQYPLFARSREEEHEHTLRNLLVRELLGPRQSKLRLVPGH